jgi:cysteinyl-tRNA synthetase
MSLIQDTNDIQLAFQNLRRKAEKQQKIYFNVISGVVRLHQEYRIAKNYEISDRLRNILNENGINIIQGTAQYDGYEKIPSNLRSNIADDQWTIKSEE